MAVSKRILGRDEVVMIDMREHYKALFLNILILFVVLIAMLLAVIYLPETWPSWVKWVVIGLGLILIAVFFCWPWLKWYNSSYTITNRRIITRHGIFSKTGHDIPLSRISNVSYQYGVVDRMFGCGTLILETSADDPLELRDVPNVERVHVQLTELLFKDANSDQF